MFKSQHARFETRAAEAIFPPCAAVRSLLEASAETAGMAASDDVVLLSPACSSFNQFREHQEQSEVRCRTAKSIGRGALAGCPNRIGKTRQNLIAPGNCIENLSNFASVFFEEKPEAKQKDRKSTRLNSSHW
jgi:hypothetical protein